MTRSKRPPSKCARPWTPRNIDDIKAKTDTLMQASHKLAEAVYQQAHQQSQAYE